MNVRDKAALALAAKVYADAVVAGHGDVKAEILEWVKEAGLVKAEWPVVGDGGEVYGTVRWNPGRQTPKVVDPAALLEWVAERYPGEVHDVPTIRQAFLDRLLKEAGEGKFPELPPGIDVAGGDPFLTVTPTAAAKHMAREVLEGQGRPTLPGLPAGPQG